jgi:hypothetical protein
LVVAVVVVAARPSNSLFRGVATVAAPAVETPRAGVGEVAVAVAAVELAVVAAAAGADAIVVATIAEAATTEVVRAIASADRACPAFTIPVAIRI